MLRFPVPVSLFLAALPLPAFAAPVLLAPDGSTPPYALVEGVLGAGAVEVPDCSHPEFGPHLIQAYDSALAAWVFALTLHVQPDNDRCLYTDRQRNEIKVSDSSPNDLKIYSGDTVFYRWRFRLDAGFQASAAFTHLHQIRPYDGDAAQPVLMLTARSKNGDSLELNHVNSSGTPRTLLRVPLAPLRGEWVEAASRLTAGSHGQYRLVLTRVSDGAVLLDYNNNDIDLWRSGTSFIRPKWGIYRSLDYPEALRDEEIRLGTLCLAKGTDTCGGAVAVPLARSAVTASSNAGKAGYTVDGRLLTRWSASGDGQWIRYDLGAPRQLSEVAIAWGKGTSLRYRFDIQVSDDAIGYTTVWSGESSGTTSRLEPYALPRPTGRYLRIVAHGNQVDAGVSIAETAVSALP
ncbi:MAG TPA: discoidin domain-containing protein [Moraxellaceae bacterium]|nr:discoidin domain-containing protein [Moraxellaceae bacterium]